MFVAFDIWRRRLAAIQSHLVLNSPYAGSQYGAITKLDMKGLEETTEQLHQLEEMAQTSGWTKRRQQDQRMKQLWKLVTAVSSKIPGSPEGKLRLRHKVWGMCNYLGAPLMYITINPSATNSPICLNLCGEEVPIFPAFDETKIPDYHTRATMVAKNPKAAAEFYHYTMKAVFDELILGGVLGETADHYFGVTECNSRQYLHCHMIVWVRGADPVRILQQLRKYEQDGDARKKDFVDKWVQYLCSVQEQSITSPEGDPREAGQVAMFSSESADFEYMEVDHEDAAAAVVAEKVDTDVDEEASCNNDPQHEHDSTQHKEKGTTKKKVFPGATCVLHVLLDDRLTDAVWEQRVMADKQSVMSSLMGQHKHDHTCVKKNPRPLTPHELQAIKDCRFRYPRALHVEPATLDVDNGFQNQRLDHTTVSHNRYLSSVLHCNTDVSITLSGLGIGVYDEDENESRDGTKKKDRFPIEDQVVAVIYYITNYISKDDLKAKHKFEMTRLAIEKEKQSRAQEESDETVPLHNPIQLAARTAQRCVNKLAAGREMPATMLTNFLMDWGDHFFSESVAPLCTTSVMNFLGGKPSSKQSLNPSSRAGGVSGEQYDGPDDCPSAVSGSVGLDDSGNFCATGDLIDYVYRPQFLGPMPYLRFFERYGVRRSCPRDRWPSTAMEFLPDHPNHNTSYVYRRNKPQMSYFVGAMPSSFARAHRDLLAKDPSHWQYRCMFQAMLFFPFRTKHDLVSDEQPDWAAALDALLTARPQYYMDHFDVAPETADEMSDRHAEDMNAFMSNMDIRLQAVEMDIHGVLDEMRLAQAAELASRVLSPDQYNVTYDSDEGPETEADPIDGSHDYLPAGCNNTAQLLRPRGWAELPKPNTTDKVHQSDFFRGLVTKGFLRTDSQPANANGTCRRKSKPSSPYWPAQDNKLQLATKNCSGWLHRQKQLHQEVLDETAGHKSSADGVPTPPTSAPPPYKRTDAAARPCADRRYAECRQISCWAG